MTMFERMISIDWSGAGIETKAVDLRVAMVDADDDSARVLSRPYTKRTIYSWTRAICRTWLEEQLRRPEPTLIALDFGFGLPWGSDEVIFGLSGWRKMASRLAAIYQESGTARATAEAINGFVHLRPHGPYRFDEDRNDFRFYIDRQIAYYRLTEVLAPQAISQWYLGSGGTVGFHTISGLAAIDHLISLREKGEIEFTIWPQETRRPDGSRHVLAESYPAICPRLATYGPCRDQHQRDAWRVLQMLIRARAEGRLSELLSIEELPIGRIDGVSFDEQIGFEGFIIGLR